MDSYKPSGESLLNLFQIGCGTGKMLRNPLDVLLDDSETHPVDGNTVVIVSDLLDVPVAESRADRIIDLYRLVVKGRGMTLDGLAITFASCRDLLIFQACWLA